jgi:hypothetical protein
MRYTEIEEAKIRERVAEVVAEGESAEHLTQILDIGQVYRNHGLTPVYIFDEERCGFLIKIAETRDKKKLH